MAKSHLSYLLLFLLPLTLFSAVQDFKSCQLKYQVSSVKIGNTQAFSINNQYVLFYSQDEPSEKIIKRDPFLGLNLMKSDKSFKHLFKFYNNYPKHLAAVSPTGSIEGRFLTHQIGLNQLGKFSKPTPNNSLISGTCCGIVGLSTDRGIIEKEYIRHFLESDKISYSDMGIRLADAKGVRVVEVNPFFVDSPFLLDDVILYMDKTEAKSAAQISRKILFAVPQSKHSFVVLRGKKELTVRVTLKKRLSGGLIPDSFFDLFGLQLDEKLVVKEDNPQYEIKKEDRLLYVMGKEVKTLADIRGILSQEKTSENKMIVLLFKRNGFDFFIHFAKP